jgi:hypothetical protein
VTASSNVEGCVCVCVCVCPPGSEDGQDGPRHVGTNITAVVWNFILCTLFVVF